MDFGSRVLAGKTITATLVRRFYSPDMAGEHVDATCALDTDYD